MSPVFLPSFHLIKGRPPFYSAIQQDTLGDYLGRGFSIGAISIPHFWLGAMVMIYTAIYWGWAPPMVYIPFTQDPLGNIGMLLIPAAIIAMTIAGQVMRMTRTMMLEVLRQDYIRTAWSKGLKERVVIIRHAIKNALNPVVTLIGLPVPWLISGSLVIEQIFEIPNIFATVIVLFTITIGIVIIAEAGLSFLGYGLSHEIPSWGGMLNWEGRQYMESNPGLAFWPGMSMMITVFSVNMFGDALHDLLDPRLRGGQGSFGAAKGKGKRGFLARLINPFNW